MKTYEVRITRLVTDRLKGFLSVEAENEEAAMSIVRGRLEEGEDPPMDYDENVTMTEHKAESALELNS